MNQKVTSGISFAVGNADIVLIDDDKMLTNAMATMMKRYGKNVDEYCDPKAFLDNISKYAKHVKICMDKKFPGKINGFDLAEKLHKDGFVNLYMFSGACFADEEIPPYLTIISKADIERLQDELLDPCKIKNGFLTYR